ncbi:MAG TPA: hypothetical protein VG734_08555 [Lacunisphaera sp.]|nr:hypothetical protein [Lacunisphaera sp.]
MKKPAAKPAPTATDKPTPMPKKEPAVDALGNRQGSQAARINAAMSKEPQTVEAIAEKAKLGVPRIRSHMAYLLKRKVATQGKDGWSLK